jgi:hypothetical protein
VLIHFNFHIAIFHYCTAGGKKNKVISKNLQVQEETIGMWRMACGENVER